jgi:hypothetical protein
VIGILSQTEGVLRRDAGVDETERVWLQPPPELASIHSGLIPSGAGSFDTVLTTALFVNGETRPLGYAMYGGLVRAAVTTEIPLAALRQMTRMLVGVPAEFLGYCGLDKLWQLTQRVLEIVDHIDSRSDLVAVLSHMAMYVNCLGGWNLQLFPWDLGDGMRQVEAAA